MGRIQKLPLPEFDGEKSFDVAPVVTRHVWNSGYVERHPLYPYAFTKVVRRDAAWSRDRNCRYLLIVRIKEGEIIYRQRERVWNVHGDRLLLIPQGAEYAFETTRNPYYYKESLYILGVNLAAITETLGLTEMEMLNVPDMKGMMDDIHEIAKLLQSGDPLLMPEMSGKTLALLSRISALKNDAEDNPMIFQMAKARLANNLENPLKISELARSLNVSQSTLERMFRKRLKTTPREFRLQCRLEQARELLKYSDLPLKEIAYKLGYCHQFHFAGEFTRHEQISPSAYRRGNATYPEP